MRSGFDESSEPKLLNADHPRSARLLRPADFARMRESSRRLSTPHLAIQYRANQAQTARLGMAVSRRVSKLAVVRNRIRRQIRESFRLHRTHLPATDILVIARPSAAMQSNHALRQDLDALWSRLVAASAGIER
jgi:ribonuclease P protein component